MKQLLSVLLILVAMTACQKEITSDIVTGNTNNGGNPAGPGLTGSMSAKIDGVLWTADKAVGATFAPALGQLPSLVNISGLSFAKKHLTITLTDSGVHNYLLSPDNLWLSAAAWVDSTQANGFSYTSNQSYIPNEPNGRVNITSIDTVRKVMSGTFSFKVYREMDSTLRNITEGVFTNIPYTKGFGLPPANASDTFRTKIDGVALNSQSITATHVAMFNQISVQGATLSLSDNVSLTMPNNITPGSYTLNFFGTTHFGAYNKAGESYASTSGTLQILEHNTTTKRIRGTFNFVATPMLAPTPTFNITDGYFSVTY